MGRFPEVIRRLGFGAQSLGEGNRGHPLKGCPSRAKTSPSMMLWFSCFVAAFSHRLPYSCRYFSLFRCQPSLHQSPIRIQAVEVFLEVQPPLPLFADHGGQGDRHLRSQSRNHLLHPPAEGVVLEGQGAQDSDAIDQLCHPQGSTPLA